MITVRKNRGPNAGFGLLEALIGAVLMIVALQAVIPLSLTTSRLAQHVRLSEVARIGARLKLDELRAMDFTALPPQHERTFVVDLDGDGKSDLPAVSGRPCQTFVVEVPGGHLSGQALQVLVDVHYDTPSGPRHYRLASVVARTGDQP